MSDAVSDALLTIFRIILIPAGLLPVATAIVLGRYRHSASASLRERSLVARVLAGLGLVTSILALLAVLEIRSGLLWIPFAAFLLAADLVSGKWLIDYLRGRFE